MISRIINFILIIIFLCSCTEQKIIESSISTGITKHPKPRSASDKNYGNYSINDVEVNLINVNKVLKKFRLLLSCFFLKPFFFITLLNSYN